MRHLVILLALGAPALAAAQCTKDTDCKGDRICVNGQCAEPQPQSAPPPQAGLPVPPEQMPRPPPPPATPQPPPPPPSQAYPQAPQPPAPPAAPPQQPQPAPPWEYRPPPPRYVVPGHLLALRGAVTGGLAFGGSSDAQSGLALASYAGFAPTFDAGVGLYFGPRGGLMLYGHWSPTLKAALGAELFSNTRWWWAGIGLGAGTFTIVYPDNSTATGAGLDFAISVLAKPLDFLGVGIDFHTLRGGNGDADGDATSLGLAVAYLY